MFDSKPLHCPFGYQQESAKRRSGETLVSALRCGRQRNVMGT